MQYFVAVHAIIMKVNLQQALTGRALRNDIFNAIAHRSLHSLSALLKRSRIKDSRYLPYSSQHTILQSESPIRRVEFYRPNSPSPPTKNHPNVKERTGRVAGRSGSGGGVQRTAEGQVSSKSKNKRSNKDDPRNTSWRPLKSKTKSSAKQKGMQSVSASKSRKGVSSRGSSSGYPQKGSQSSRPSGKSRLDLSSIIEQGQERVITPSSRKSRKEPSRRSAEKTHKKGRKQEISGSMCRKLERMCRQPSKFMRVLRGEWVTVRVRVQRRKILEFQVQTHRQLSRLNVVLERGNLDCQHIEERYIGLPAHSRFSLFSCMRSVDIDRPFLLPKLQLQAILENGSTFQRQITVPYSCLFLATEGKPQPRSRIITKACLQGTVIDTQKLRTLTLTLPRWRSRHIRGESLLRSEFSVGGQNFTFVVGEAEGRWNLQLVGQGEARLQRLLSFLLVFLRPC